MFPLDGRNRYQNHPSVKDSAAPLVAGLVDWFDDHGCLYRMSSHMFGKLAGHNPQRKYSKSMKKREGTEGEGPET